MRPDVESIAEQVFAALADPTRRAILARLAQGEATVQDLARPCASSQPAISRQLKVLEDAGLIRRERVARTRPVHLDPEGLRRAGAWIDHYRKYWEGAFERMDLAHHSLAEGAGENGFHVENRHQLAVLQFGDGRDEVMAA